MNGLRVSRAFSTLLKRDLHTSKGVNQQAAVQLDFYEEEQRSMQKTARRIVDEDINPYVDQWEAEGMYPAAQVFKKLGDAGLKIPFHSHFECTLEGRKI